MSATDIQQTQDYIRHVDSAIQASAEDIDSYCNRRFYNVVETHAWDWPNFQRAYPWRIWFDKSELADVTTNVPVVTSGGNVIPAEDIFWYPANYSPPFTWLELNRATSASFGQGDTPQRDVTVTGTFGYNTQSRPGGVLAAAVSTTTGTAITVSNSALVDVGHIITVDAESMLVSDNAMSDTGQAQQSSGCSTALNSDNVLEVTTGADFFADEVVQLDAEWMLILAVTGNSLMVLRAYNGTVIDEHSSAEIYALRSLTVLRGSYGTVAATHSNSAPITVAMVPYDVHELAIGESLNYVFQKTSGYARQIGEAGATPVPGGSLPDLRLLVYEKHGRKLRRRVV